MKRGLSDLMLRFGVAFAFLYPPLSALNDPDSWFGYFPAFVKGFVPDMMLLHVFGVIEVIIALWILSGWRIALPSLLATVMLVAIVVFNPSNFIVLFRDLTIATMTLALFIAHRTPPSHEGRT